MPNERSGVVTGGGGSGDSDGCSEHDGDGKDKGWEEEVEVEVEVEVEEEEEGWERVSDAYGLIPKTSNLNWERDDNDTARSGKTALFGQ